MNSKTKEKENQPPADDSEGDNGKKNNYALKIGTCFFIFLSSSWNDQASKKKTKRSC